MNRLLVIPLQVLLVYGLAFMVILPVVVVGLPGFHSCVMPVLCLFY